MSGGPPSSGGEVGIDGPVFANHHIQRDGLGGNVLQPLRRDTLEPRQELKLGVDDECATETLSRRAGKRHQKGQDDGEALARAGLTEHQRVACEHRTGHLARWRIQHPPLRDGEPDLHVGAPLGRVTRVADPVDETERSRKRCRDGAIELRELPVRTGQGFAVAGKHCVVEGAPEPLGQRLYSRATPQRAGAPGDGRDQTHEYLPISGLGLMRNYGAPLQRAFDEVFDDALINAREFFEVLRAVLRGDRAWIVLARVVIEQHGSWLGDTLVTERKQHRGGARRAGVDERADMHIALAPALEGRHHVLECLD